MCVHFIYCDIFSLMACNNMLAILVSLEVGTKETCMSAHLIYTSVMTND